MYIYIHGRIHMPTLALKGSFQAMTFLQGRLATSGGPWLRRPQNLPASLLWIVGAKPIRITRL